MAKPKDIPWWEDDKQSKEVSCACCTSCRLHIKSGRCMCGGPFIGYMKVDKDGRPVKEEEGGKAEGNTGTESGKEERT